MTHSGSDGADGDDTTNSHPGSTKMIAHQDSVVAGPRPLRRGIGLVSNGRRRR